MSFVVTCPKCQSPLSIEVTPVASNFCCPICQTVFTATATDTANVAACPPQQNAPDGFIVLHPQGIQNRNNRMKMSRRRNPTVAVVCAVVAFVALGAAGSFGVLAMRGQSSLDRVQQGMSLAQVEAILGKGERSPHNESESAAVKAMNSLESLGFGTGARYKLLDVLSMEWTIGFTRYKLYFHNDRLLYKAPSSQHYNFYQDREDGGKIVRQEMMSG